MTTPGAVIAGKFRLERLVGRGGMGSVWRGRHLRLDMPVAIKFMEATAAGAPDARLRFEREAKAAAQIRSPHVVQVLDHGVDEDAPYIVMELLEGEDLGVRLRRVGRMSPEGFEPLLAQAAKGLRRAHEGGIVHRDLKPGNIFLARSHGEEVVKLLDFGVAKLRGGALGNVTQTGMLLGSPSYMSPEQARGHQTVDHRSDLWALGVIIFRALTGVKPFVADSVAELIIKLCMEPPPVASQVMPGLPPALDAFFTRAFEQDPGRRFQSALEMHAAFAAIARASAVGVAGVAGAVEPISPPALQPPPPEAAEASVTPSSQSAPLSAEAFLRAREALEHAVSRTAPLESDAAQRMTVPLDAAQAATPAPPLTAAAAVEAQAAAPAPQPALQTPRSAPRIPVADVAPALPQDAPGSRVDDEVALYLAGGIGGPVAGAVMPAVSEPTGASISASAASGSYLLGSGDQEAQLAGSGAPDSGLQRGSSTFNTTSRTLNLPSGNARRLIVAGTVAAMAVALVLVVALLAGGSGENDGAQAESGEARPAGASTAPAPLAGPGPTSADPAAAGRPAPPSPPSPPPTPSDEPVAAPMPDDGAAGTPGAAAAQGTAAGAGAGAGVARDGVSPASPGPGAAPAATTHGRPGWKRPTGSTKKPKGVDLGY